MGQHIEAVGPLLALATWPDMVNMLWIHFIDNTTAKGALIKGSSTNGELNELMFHTWRLAHKRNLHLWFEYVNTHDNPIDKASPGCTDNLYGQSWRVVLPGNWIQHLL